MRLALHHAMRARGSHKKRRSRSSQMQSLSARTGSKCVHRRLQQQQLRPSVQARSFLSNLFGGAGRGDMGGTTSTQTRGWTPSTGTEPRKISRSGYDVTPLTREQREAAAQNLPKMAKYITLEHGTERAFTGSTVDGTPHDSKARGTWVCALGGLPLFTTDTKFNSGTGWPSFFAPVDKEHIVEVVDTSIPYMPRTEVLCARSGAHLGHVFDDGPRPTGKRYCINAAALRFIPEGEPLPPESQPVQPPKQ